MGDKGSGKNNGKGASKEAKTPEEQTKIRKAAQARRRHRRAKSPDRGDSNILRETQEDHRKIVVARHCELLTEQLMQSHYTEAMTLLAKQIIVTYRSMSFSDMHLGGTLQPLQAILQRTERKLIEINAALLESYWSEWEQVQENFKTAWVRARYNQAQTEVNNDRTLRHRLLVEA